MVDPLVGEPAAADVWGAEQLEAGIGNVADTSETPWRTESRIWMLAVEQPVLDQHWMESLQAIWRVGVQGWTRDEVRPAVGHGDQPR